MNSKQTRRSNYSRFDQSRYPSAIKQKPEFVRVFRFSASEAVSDIPITRQCLLRLIYDWNAVQTIGYFLFSGIKLDRVCIWGNNDTNSFSTVSLEWQSRNGPSNLLTDTGTLSRPAHVSTAPPRNSLAGFWSQFRDGVTTNQEVLFYLSCPQGSIVDVHVTCVIANGNAGTEVDHVTTVTVPGSVGMFYNVLNSITPTGAVGAGTLQPVSCASAGIAT